MTLSNNQNVGQIKLAEWEEIVDGHETIKVKQGQYMEGEHRRTYKTQDIGNTTDK